MTYDEWLKTERQHTDLAEADNSFGYVPDGAQTVVRFDPGVAVILGDGKWYTHIDRSEYTGTADEIRKVLWDEYAQHEVGISPWCTTTPPKEADE